MLIAWFVVSALVASIAFLGTAQDSLSFIKNFRQEPKWGIFVIFVNLLYLSVMVLGIINLIQRYSYDSREIRCSSIDGSVYDRKDHKCYVNGEEK